MIKPRLFLCSGATMPEEAAKEDRTTIKLTTQGHDANVHLHLEDVAWILKEDLTARLVDFLEIAAYVYSADASTDRGAGWIDDGATEQWDRDFRFIIPVRDPAFWCQQTVQDALCRTLSYLSNDKYTFDFTPLEQDQPVQAYLDLGDQEDWPFHDVDRVTMFSGGLDSLAGAVESARKGERLVLVSHRPTATMDHRQKELYDELSKHVSVPLIRVPVTVNKETNLGREYTQRTRSFLFTALGTAVAVSVRAKGVRFFENGVVSLNLGIANEVLRARASRTTHPTTLHNLTHLCTLILGRDFVVDNPYLFYTKADIVRIVNECDAAPLIQYTRSCAHTMFGSKTQWHCGTCSQCIDRRIAVLSAGLQAYDPSHDYESDVFVGRRDDGYQRNMAIGYVRHALEIYQGGERGLLTTFNRELTQATRFLKPRRDAADRLVKMHVQHASAVRDVLLQQLKEHADMVLDGTLPSSSMLALVQGQQHLQTTWKRYACEITDLLQRGVPLTCKTEKPKTEPRLQEICDGILRARESQLIREYPLMRWSSTKTKPDWSDERALLWVELKYVRRKADISPILQAIAADITEYGDNMRHVLFVVYDPDHHIGLADEEAFKEPISKRSDNMQISVIR